ncbi:hypothetical protein TWF281_002215 [Arthrobotrys megalospora]
MTGTKGGVFGSHNASPTRGKVFDPHASGSKWNRAHLKHLRVLKKELGCPLPYLQENYLRCEEAIAASSQAKDFEGFCHLQTGVLTSLNPTRLSLEAGGTQFGPLLVVISDAIRKDETRFLAVGPGHRNRASTRLSQNPSGPTRSLEQLTSSSPEQLPSSSPEQSTGRPKTSESDSTYSDSRNSESTGQQDESKYEPMVQYLACQFIQGVLMEYMKPVSLFSACHPTKINPDRAYIWYESWPHHYGVKTSTIDCNVLDDGCLTLLMKGPAATEGLEMWNPESQFQTRLWICPVETKRIQLNQGATELATEDSTCQRLGQNVAEIWGIITRRIEDYMLRKRYQKVDLEKAIDELPDIDLRFRIATANFSREYLKAYLLPGQILDLDDEKQYLKVEFSHARDLAKRSHRKGAIIMMASLIDYFHNVEIVDSGSLHIDWDGDEPRDWGAFQDYGMDTDESEGRMDEDEDLGDPMDSDQENHYTNQEEDFTDELAQFIGRGGKEKES